MSGCDCDFWDSKHRWHCGTNYPTPAPVAGETTDAGVGEGLTVEQASALVGDDIAYWLGNKFMSPEMLAEKVAWWMSAAATRAADDRAGSTPCG